MAGLRHLEEIGISAVEVDVQNALGRVPVIWHDPWLKPEKVRNAAGEWLTGAGPKIIETSYEDLKTYDVGALQLGSEVQETFSAQARLDEVSIPLLEDFCRWAVELPDMVVNLEIKSFADRSDLGDAPEVLADTVLTEIERFDLKNRTLISSFDWRVLSVVARKDPGISRGYLSYQHASVATEDVNIIDGSPWIDGMRLADHQNSVPRMVAAAGGVVWGPYYKDVSQADLDLAHELGLIVNVWTVNEDEDLKRMTAMGVDGLITDYPARARQTAEDGCQKQGKPNEHRNKNRELESQPMPSA